MGFEQTELDDLAKPDLIVSHLIRDTAPVRGYRKILFYTVKQDTTAGPSYTYGGQSVTLDRLDGFVANGSVCALEQPLTLKPGEHPFIDPDLNVSLARFDTDSQTWVDRRPTGQVMN